jgi:hypothetical protein
MSARSGNRVGVLEWVVVLGVGAIVVALVLGLNLIPRLNDGQKVLNAARPAFNAQRLAGDRAGIDFISSNVDMADPIMTPAGGAVAEVPKLVAFVSEKTGLSQAAVLAALQQNFPHTTALLEAIPLSAVTQELPGLVAFLSKELKATPAQIAGALKSSFPALAQAITNLPAVTGGWESIPGLDGLTRFDGTPVKSMPQLRTYLSSDVIPVLETQRSHYAHLMSTSKINFVGWLVLIIGIIVIIYGLLMLFEARRLEPGARSGVPQPA